jgi:glycerol-1-phosphate dehydrogenase [NAD(P)+]
MANPPVAIIVDIDVMLQAPRRLARSGLGDAISKIIAVRDWRLAHERTGEYYGEYAAQLALMAADVVKGYAEGIGRGDREGTRTLVEALISDGVAAGIAGSSRPCSGSEHLFSHSLDIHSSEHALHGEQCGVGSIIMAYLHGLDVGDIRDTLKIAGAPINAYDLGISEGNIVKALSLASMVRPERYTILNEVELDEERAREVARAVEVI